MSMESLSTDKKISTITPVVSPTSTQLPKDFKVETQNTTATTIESDATSLQASKGRIPSTSVFETSNAPAFEKSALSEVQKSANNKTQLQSYLSALEKFDPSKGIDAIDDQTMNELSSLGFDISEENGQVVIKDSKGNSISPQDFAKAQENLKSALKRELGSSEKVSSRPNTEISGNVVKPSNDTAAPKQMSEADQQRLVEALKTQGQAQTQLKSEISVKKEILETSLQELDRMVFQAQKKTEKIDTGISQILALKSQADSLIQKGKSGSLSDIEKNQLKSLVTTMTMKQKDLKNDQEASELLLKQIDTVFNQVSGNLNESERATKDNMQAALKAKISGQGLTARQDFVSAIQEDVYKLTKDMSPEQVDKLMSDPSERMKLFAPTNKLVDKMNSAKSLSEFSAQDLDTLKTKFNIRASEENGKLVFYHQSKGVESKVTLDDIKSFRTDLNNIVSSPDLFTVARAAGQISIAYSPEKLIDNKNQEAKNEDTNPVILDVKKVKEEKAQSLDSKDSSKSKKLGESAEVIDEKSNKVLKMQEISSLDKSIDKKREQEKYHQQQLSGILEKRREANKFMETKRVEDSSLEKDTQMRLDSKDQELRVAAQEIKNKASKK